MSRGYTALIVEDDAIIAMDIQAQLAEIGCTMTRIVHSAPDALATAREMRPDLIIMDVHLRSRMTGIEAAELLRKEMLVSIIFVTGNIELVERSQIRSEQPYTNALSKPILRPLFRATVEEALAGTA